MKALILLVVMASPAVIGSLTVVQLGKPVGFVIALAVSMVLLREAVLICMMLMRHWQLFGCDRFLIEENGRHRWVDVFELTAMRRPCRIRARQFHPDFRLRRPD